MFGIRRYESDQHQWMRVGREDGTAGFGFIRGWTSNDHDQVQSTVYLP